MDAIAASSPSILSNPPLAEARPFDRDGRKKIIQRIQRTTGKALICYIAQDELILPEDTVYTQELLYPLKAGTSVDLLLNTPGGDIDTAEKLVHMIRQVTTPTDGDIPTGDFRIVVPDKAKSAGTLVALGANAIVMSDTSELGPIDPQVRLPDQNGNQHWHSVFNYIESYEAAAENLRREPADPVFRMTMAKFDPVLLRKVEQVRDRARTCAENLLKRHGGNFTLTPSRLMDTERFPSHGQMIDWETAKLDLDLNILFLGNKDPLWRLYWELYCYLRMALAGNRKIFESLQTSVIL
ncbi:MAG: hypothetical protein OXF11_04875 [Deltaproteobacteria bacterium]|nr:hypothetical protein [Deltaproteobacteria bacterium]